MARRPVILATYLVFGAYAVCAQAMLLREVHVLVFGSELSWGLVLAFWLAGVAAGAGAAGRLIPRARRPWITMAAAALTMPAVLAAEVVLLRLVRPLLGAGPGEYVGPGAMVLVTLVATLPVSIWVGAAFPAASALVARWQDGSAEKARRIGWVYLVEAAGSLIGGALFSFVLVGRAGAMAIALGGGILLAAMAVFLVRAYAERRWAIAIPLLYAVTLFALIATGAARQLEDFSVRRRWESFATGLELVRSEDTRYQNVALGRLGEQFSLYTNGMVSATWPNRADLAIEAHLTACEAPSLRRILVLGGGEEGLLEELLRYKPERLDFVLLDRQLLSLVRPYLEPPDRRAMEALANSTHFTDTRRFVRRAAAEGAAPYDLILLAGPEPMSALEARLYTREFFEQLAAVLADDGVLALTLSAPLGYWSPEPAYYVGSIVRPLEQVFPEVLLTFSSPMRCFAAKRRGVLVESGDALAARYRSRGMESPAFDPLWFEGASDLLDAEKRAGTARALAAHPPPFPNTDDRPAAALYRMRYWLQTSEAAHPEANRPAERRLDLFSALLGLRFEWVVWSVLILTVLWAAAGLARGRDAFGRAALLWSVGTTGFAAMALEMILLYTFQVLYGYVYSMIGAVVGLFMFGLVLGSAAMNRRLRRTSEEANERPGLRTLAALDLALTVFAAGLVLGLGALRGSAAEWPIQAATFALVAVTGILTGLVFPLAASVALENRPSAGRAAGAVDAADHVGACLGALGTGVLLVPILGVTGACLIVAATKAFSAIVVGAASIRRPVLASA